MSNVILVVLCFLLGIFFRKFSESNVSKDILVFPVETPKVFNAFIIYVSLPSLILLHIHKLEFKKEMIALIAMPWILFIVSFVLINSLGTIFSWNFSLRGSLILTSGLGNTSFLGIPMIKAYYEDEYVSLGLVSDQAGTFLVLSTLGILVASRYSTESGQNKISFLGLLKRVSFFPPFLFFFIALLLRGVAYPLWFEELLKILGDTLSPLALFSVGFQLKFSDFKQDKNYLLVGLFFKLILAPLLIAFLYSFFSLSQEVYNISIFEAAMAPMITGGIVAISYQLRPSLVVLMLAVGIPLSFVTLPFFWFFFH